MRSYNVSSSHRAASDYDERGVSSTQIGGSGFRVSLRSQAPRFLSTAITGAIVTGRDFVRMLVDIMFEPTIVETIARTDASMRTPRRVGPSEPITCELRAFRARNLRRSPM